MRNAGLYLKGATVLYGYLEACVRTSVKVGKNKTSLTGSTPREYQSKFSTHHSSGKRCNRRGLLR